MIVAILLAALSSAIVPVGRPFTCTPIRIARDSGLTCAEGPRIRLPGISSRERLVRLLGGRHGTYGNGEIMLRAKALRCKSSGRADGNRTGAHCSMRHVGDLSCATHDHYFAHRCGPRP